MRVIVTGGAGYIGSFMTKLLLNNGNEVTVIDSLERGHKDAIDNRATLEVGNLLDESFVSSVFEKQQVDAVIHFAGFISMAESMRTPSLYFRNNTEATLNLLDEMQKRQVKHIIFSSTAGVYGNPVTIPIPESHTKNPENPYGESKYLVERILQWYQAIHGINFVSLRYFNAAGADLDATAGESHEPESHIIPNAIRSIVEKKSFTLYGTDYKTPDGTCIRDYVHVLDLTQAHLLALEYLQKNTGGHAFNVGTGIGHSNREVLKMIQEVSGSHLQIEERDRRPGDADMLVADVSAIKTQLGFSPQYSDLRTIITTAWEWHNKK